MSRDAAITSFSAMVVVDKQKEDYLLVLGAVW